MVKDIMPGPDSSGPGSLTDVGGTLYFTAGYEPEELWKSDGTAAGTVMVIPPAWWSLYPLTAVADTLYFVGRDFENMDFPAGASLWKSDGTATGTVMVKYFDPNTTPGALAAVGAPCTSQPATTRTGASCGSRMGPSLEL